MSDNSAIEWCDASWNPLRVRDPQQDARPRQPVVQPVGRVGWSCVKVSPGCQHCYAETMNMRLGTGLNYSVPFNVRVQHYLDENALAKARRWRKPRRVFVCSMTDLFGEWVPDAHIFEIFRTIAHSPRHTFQVLTKRAQRMYDFMSEAEQDGIVCDDHAHPLPLANAWLGVSAEDQRRAQERVMPLLDTPAAVRFVSYEPALGPVDFEAAGAFPLTPLEFRRQAPDVDWHGIDWIIAGGESGTRARACYVEWIRDVVAQCRRHGAAVFVKQLGRIPAYQAHAADEIHEQRGRVVRCAGVHAYRLPDRKGGKPETWPAELADLNIREYPMVKQ